MKNRIFMFIAFFISIFIAQDFFRTEYKDYLTQKRGKEILVLVHNIPQCSRSINRMDIKHKGRIYTIDIGKNECINQKYKVGNQVQVLFDKNLNHFVMLEGSNNIGFYLSLLFFLVPIYFIYRLRYNNQDD